MEICIGVVLAAVGLFVVLAALARIHEMNVVRAMKEEERRRKDAEWRESIE